MLKQMLQSDSWKLFKEYNNELVLAYLMTVESKEFLRGMRFCLTKFEEDLERIIKQ